MYYLESEIAVLEETNKVTSQIVATVVTYNRKELLAECINALLNSEMPCDILIVDNFSTDGTEESIKPFLANKRVNYVNTGANLGGAGGFNFAINYASQLNYEYFWLMDDDTIVHSDTLVKLMTTAKKLDNKFGFLCSFANFTDGTACKMNIPTLSKRWFEMNGKISGVLRVEKATFVAFLVRKEAVKKVGLPIKDFFIWADDSEYSYRLTQSYPCYLVSDSQVTHKMKQNADANFNTFLSEDSSRVERYFYSFRNRYFIAKEQGFKSVFSFTLKLVGFLLLTPFLAKNSRWKKTKIVFNGLIKGITFNPKIEFLGDEVVK